MLTAQHPKPAKDTPVLFWAHLKKLKLPAQIIPGKTGLLITSNVLCNLNKEAK
jgi:hypothetical protein